MALLCILAASLWGSPDGGLTYPGGPKSPAGQAFSARYWDVNAPSDLAQTAVQELAGGTATAGYGPPFNQTTGASQEFIGIKPAEIAKAIFGLTLPINTANDFVLAPVSQLAAPSSPAVAAAVSLYKAAGGDLSPGAPAGQVASSRQMTWLNNYAKALAASQREVHAHLDHGEGRQLRAGPGHHRSRAGHREQREPGRLPPGQPAAAEHGHHHGDDVLQRQHAVGDHRARPRASAATSGAS